VVYVTAGLGMLINGKYFKNAIDNMIKSSGLVLIGGVMALVVGFLIVNSHNVWVKDWTVLVTILGWLALVKGVALFLIPQPFMKFAKLFTAKVWLFGIFALILGGVFGYFGFYV
jgi:hypothetical protein